MKAEVVCDGIRFAEGPVWCGNNALVVTSVAEGRLYRVEPDQNRATVFADTGGGANGAALAADGSILVTQNGGFDFAATGLFADPPPFFVPTTPGLQLATPDGTVTYLADDGFQSPNDLAVAFDGSVYFTDPPHYPPPEGARAASCVSHATAPSRRSRPGSGTATASPSSPTAASSSSSGPGCNASIPTAHASG